MLVSQTAPHLGHSGNRIVRDPSIILQGISSVLSALPKPVQRVGKSGAGGFVEEMLVYAMCCRRQHHILATHEML